MAEKPIYPKPLASGVSVEINYDLMQALADGGAAVGRLKGVSQYVPQTQGVLRNMALRDGKSLLVEEGRGVDPLDLLETELETPDAMDPNVRLLRCYTDTVLDWIPQNAEQNFTPEMLLQLHQKWYRDVRKESGSFREDEQPEISAVKFRGKETYTAPAGQTLKALVDDYCTFMGENQRFPALIKAGILEAQWTAMQPFVEGNNLIRSIILHRYFLNNLGLSSPFCPLQRVWKKRRIEYAFRIQSLLLEEDWNEWLVFFLRGVEEAAQWSVEVLMSIEQLSRHHEELLTEFSGNDKLARSLIEYWYTQPLLNIQHASDHLDVVFVTANTVIRQLEHIEIVREITGQRRNKRYLFHNYYQLFSS